MGSGWKEGSLKNRKEGVDCQSQPAGALTAMSFEMIRDSSAYCYEMMKRGRFSCQIMEVVELEQILDDGDIAVLTFLRGKTND